MVGWSFVLTGNAEVIVTSSPLLPPLPESSFLETPEGYTPEFCSEWNPEYAFQGYQCCGSKTFSSDSISSKGKNSRDPSSRRRRRRRSSAPFCAPGRNGSNRCSERTFEQIQFESEIKQKIKDQKLGEHEVIDLLEERIQRQVELKARSQAYCGFSNGFVVDALPIVPSPFNRLMLNSEDRCTNYGTDYLLYLMEFLGQSIRTEFREDEFQNARLVIGDAVAPRGGCLAVRRGRRGHKSHTNGQDIDIAFFNPRAMTPSQVEEARRYRAKNKANEVPESLMPSRMFTNDMFVASNWWLLKKMYSEENEKTCVRNIFLDRRHIDQLNRYSASIGEQELFKKISDYISHEKGHLHHFHLRVVPKGKNGECLSGREIKRRGKEVESEEGENLMADEESSGEESFDPASETGSDSSFESSDDGEEGSGDNLYDGTDYSGNQAISDLKDQLKERVSASQNAAKLSPSELFAQSQKDIKKTEADKAPSVFANDLLKPDYKREPSITQKFPLSSGKKRKGSKRHKGKKTLHRSKKR